MNRTPSNSLVALEQRSVQLSIYFDIIPSVLCVGKVLSVTKLLVLSFIIKHRFYSGARSYDGHAKAFFLRKATCDASGSFIQFLDETRYFCEAMLLLLESEIVCYGQDGELRLHGGEPSSILVLGKFESRLIKECRNLDDSFVLSEVLRNV